MESNDAEFARISYRIDVYLQILDFLNEFNVLLAEAGLVRGDIDDGAVQFLDLNIQFRDIDFEFLNVLGNHDFLLADGFNLGQQFIDFLLELGLFLLSPANTCMIISNTLNFKI